MYPIFGCNEVDLLSLENYSKKSKLTYTPTETLAIILWEEKNNTSLVILTIEVHTFALKYKRAHEMCLCFLCCELRLKSLSPTYVFFRTLNWPGNEINHSIWLTICMNASKAFNENYSQRSHCFTSHKGVYLNSNDWKRLFMHWEAYNLVKM